MFYLPLASIEDVLRNKPHLVLGQTLLNQMHLLVHWHPAFSKCWREFCAERAPGYLAKKSHCYGSGHHLNIAFSRRFSWLVSFFWAHISAVITVCFVALFLGAEGNHASCHKAPVSILGYIISKDYKRYENRFGWKNYFWVVGEESEPYGARRTPNLCKLCLNSTTIAQGQRSVLHLGAHSSILHIAKRSGRASFFLFRTFSERTLWIEIIKQNLLLISSSLETWQSSHRAPLSN